MPLVSFFKLFSSMGWQFVILRFFFVLETKKVSKDLFFGDHNKVFDLSFLFFSKGLLLLLTKTLFLQNSTFFFHKSYRTCVVNLPRPPPQTQIVQTRPKCFCSGRKRL